MKALIVDGGQALRTMVGYMLDAEGFDVRHAPGTDELMGFLDKGFAPDVVVAFQSKSVSDLTHLRWLKAHPSMKRVPMVMVAHKEDLERQMEWKEAGVTCWLTWPVTHEQLLEMVRMVVFPEKSRVSES
jgi:DNA-binding response OmpR family regulator